MDYDIVKYKLTSHDRRSPHLYGLPKIHKPYIFLTATVSSIGSPYFVLVGFLLHREIGPFRTIVEIVSLQSLHTLVSFDAVSIFTTVPVDEALQVARNKLNNDLHCRSKPSWNCWKFVREPYIFR
jgi:hypothetical protein